MPPRPKTAFSIILVALVLRGILFSAVFSHPERVVHRDTNGYLLPAVNILAGHGFSRQETPPYTPDIYRTPVYPIFIAALYAVFGQHLLIISGAQVLLGAASAGLTYLLGTQLLAEKKARTGGLLLALSLGATVYTMYILTETLFTLLLLGTTWALVAYRKAPKWHRLVGAATLAGLTTLCRPIALPYVLFAALLAAWAHPGNWWQRSRVVLAFVALACSILMPWLARNYYLIGTPTLSAISNYNMLFYNAASLEADLRGIGQAQARAEMVERVQAELVRQGKTNDQAFQITLYDEWSRQIILSHPWRYLYVHVKNDVNSLLPNITEFLELLGVTQGSKGTLSVLNERGPWAAIQHYFGGQIWVLWPMLPAVALLALTYLGALIGTGLLIRHRDWFTLALLLSTLSYFLLVPGAPAHPRFRVPVMPHICLLAGIGLVPVGQWIRQRMKAFSTQKQITQNSF